MPAARISFSQYQMWKGCPHRWKLNYIDKVSIPSPSIALVFGTAMHEVFQKYLEVLYTSSVQAANDLLLEDLLKERMSSEYKKMLAENNDQHFSHRDEMQEHLSDGIEIIRWFKARREEFFMKKGWELVGIEKPINIIPLESHPSVRLIGFLDLVMRDLKTGKIYIYDFKTSTNGWGKYAKSDKVKTAQLVLYKTYYAKQYDIHPDDIEIEYLILRRKIDENAEYAAMKRRIQRFAPAHGKVSQGNIVKEVEKFITTVFDVDGNKRTDIQYIANAGENGNNCRFCEFKDNNELCPIKNRVHV